MDKKTSRKNRNRKIRSKNTINRKPQSLNKQKKEILENVVAAIYKTPGVTIRQNVNYPTSDGESTREIDIVLKTHIAGLPVEYAFQCKNEKKPLDVNKVGEFVGALDDIGIPFKYGILISVNGFTSGAIRRAKKSGIKTLVLKGLTKDRLKTEINSAFQHNISLVPRVDHITVTNNIEKSEFDYQFVVFFDEKGEPVGTVNDLIFNKWRNNEVPEKLGTHKIELEPPVNWFQFYKGKKVEAIKITADITVIAVVMKLEGTSKTHLLLDAETNRLEKSNQNIEFDELQVGKEIPLHIFYTEEELEEFLRNSDVPNISIKVKLLRLISNFTYYPYSKEVADVMFGFLENCKNKRKNPTQDDFNRKVYKVSENDLFRKGIFNIFGREASVIITDNSGDMIDVTLLASEANYYEVLSLKDRYFENPFKFFGDILSWAYKEKSLEFSEKAFKSKTEKISLLLKEALKNIQLALKLDPNSLPKLEQLATIYFGLEDYPKSLEVIDYLLERENEVFNLLLMKLQTLIRLENWKECESVIRKLEKGLKKKAYKESKTVVVFYKAEVLNGLGKYKLSWKNLSRIWQDKPEEVIYLASRTTLINKLHESISNVEIEMFFIEVLYFRSTVNLKIKEYEKALKNSEYATDRLTNLEKVQSVEGAKNILGKVNSNLVEKTLRRIIKNMKGIDDKEFAKRLIKVIENWYEQNFDKKLNTITD